MGRDFLSLAMFFDKGREVLWLGKSSEDAS
jgi:hypothetical protein